MRLTEREFNRHWRSPLPGVADPRLRGKLNSDAGPASTKSDPVLSISAHRAFDRFASVQPRAGLDRATQAIIGRRTYQDLPTLTQHYWDLSRSEPINSLRTPLIRVVCGVSRNRPGGTSSCLRSCNQRFISSLDGGRSSRRRRGALPNGVDDGRAALAKRSF